MRAASIIKQHNSEYVFLNDGVTLSSFFISNKASQRKPRMVMKCGHAELQIEQGQSMHQFGMTSVHICNQET